MWRLRVRHGIVACTAWILMAAAPAVAQEGTAPDWANKNGAVGLGFNTTMGGTNGLVFRTYVSPLFGIQGTLGFDIISTSDTPEGSDESFTVSSSAFLIGAYATYKIAYWQRGSLSVLFGGDIHAISSSVDAFGSDNDTETSTTNVLLGLGLQAEWFPTQYLSLFAQGGLRIDFLGNDDFEAVLPDEDVSVVDVSFGSDLLGAAGVVVWFK